MFNMQPSKGKKFDRVQTIFVLYGSKNHPRKSILQRAINAFCEKSDDTQNFEYKARHTIRMHHSTRRACLIVLHVPVAIGIRKRIVDV